MHNHDSTHSDDQFASFTGILNGVVISAVLFAIGAGVYFLVTTYLHLQ